MLVMQVSQIKSRSQRELITFNVMVLLNSLEQSKKTFARTNKKSKNGKKWITINLLLLFWLGHLLMLIASSQLYIYTVFLLFKNYTFKKFHSHLLGQNRWLVQCFLSVLRFWEREPRFPFNISCFTLVI